MNPNLQRAMLLCEQNRPELAVEYFRQALGDEPDESIIHASFAVCLADLEQLDDAEHHARRAIELDPDLDFNHYAAGYVLDERKRFKEAAAAALEAIRLDPEEPMYWALLASIRGQQERWQDALEAAENGLRHDPAHPGCVNIRSMALQLLGRRQEADAATEAALARDPENPLSHYTRGMALLESGQRKQAMYHFREALRIEPNFEPAREGIVMALKSANPLYRPFLAFAFWLARRGSKWGLILPIGLWLLLQAGRALSNTYPALEPWIGPATYAYLALIAVTWLGPHIFDMVVMVHPLGRHALPRRRKVAAWVIVAMALTGGGLLLATWLSGWVLFLLLGIPLLFLTIPVAGLFRAEAGWPRKVLLLVAAGCVGMVLVSFGLLFLQSDWDRFFGVWQASLWACAIASWVSIFLAPITPTR
jgi:tetratricopeptide (TPR) repeat protein